MVVKPTFFDNFKCIADKCTDTCCKGWEIDVDADTLDFYNQIDGDDGEFVRARLIHGDGVKLCLEGERCRFLREDNLCELIIRLGEECLCDICREHPRFYSQSENICEVGVGLCCPEAARLWLEFPSEFIIEDDEYTPSESERRSLEAQIEVINFLAHGDGTLGKRLFSLLGGEYAENTYEQLRVLYASLEALDEHFGESFCMELPRVSDERFARLAAYFVYRYWFLLGKELCIKFCAASLVMIAAMVKELPEAAKDYSKEVEYDPDNLDKIYAHLSSVNTLGALCLRTFTK